MQKSTNNQRHVRDTLIILMSKATHDSVRLIEMISEETERISCSKLMTVMLYERLLMKSLSTTSSYNTMDLWLPEGVFGKLGTIKVFEKWLTLNDRVSDMNASDLLLIGSVTGWHASWRALVKLGLVRVTRTNKIRVEYPIDGEMYSLDYAGMKMRGLLKKKVDEKPPLDKTDTSDVVSPPKEVIPDDNFWDKK